jgi:hypothetical protein
MMKLWNNLNTNEKAMLIIIAGLLLIVLLSWNRISDGLTKGFKPYMEKHPVNQTQ